MKVLVVGASGAIGKPVVRLLAAGGHEVIAASRTPEPDAADAGVTVTSLDLLDRAAVLRLVGEQRPEAIVHLATAIPDPVDPKRIGAQFATTNRLRTEGTAHLIAAARAAGVRRLIVQGLAYAYQPGDAVRDEDEPLWSDPPRSFAPVAAALAEMEELTRAADGTVLRLGHIYGPGTIYAPDGSSTAMVRAGKLPVVGKGAARFSFIHVEDVASAVLAALDHPSGGTFNIVDDEPVLLRTWLPSFAEVLGAPAPKRVPAFLARLAVGPFGVVFMNELAGASNVRARQVLRWRPRFSRFADGVAADLATRPSVAGG